MAKIITFVSAEEGVGKSTLCASLALALAQRGKRVLLIDLSPSNPALDILLGVGESVVYTVKDVADADLAPEKALISFEKDPKVKGKENLFLAPLVPSVIESGEGVGEAVTLLSHAAEADVTVVDASASLYPSLFSVSDERILVTDTRQTALRAAEALVQAHAESAPLDRFLLSRASLVRERIMKDEPLLDIIDRISLPLLGILPYSELLRECGLLLGKRHAKAPFARAVGNVAERLLGTSVPLLRGISLEGISRRFFIERSEKR